MHEARDLTDGDHQPFEVVSTLIGIGLQFVTKLEFWKACAHTCNWYEAMVRPLEGLLEAVDDIDSYPQVCRTNKLEPDESQQARHGLINPLRDERDS